MKIEDSQDKNIVLKMNFGIIPNPILNWIWYNYSNQFLNKADFILFKPLKKDSFLKSFLKTIIFPKSHPLQLN
jgi:hypothetical protein